jgi:MerR family transcriptional regulator, heat shock protein HspR
MAGGFYSEASVARTLRIRKSTLRKMEEEGIISPKSRFGKRWYSVEQVEDLLFARDLIYDMGVNLAGVEVALRMRKNMRGLNNQLEQIFEYLKQRMEEDWDQD